MVRVPTWSLAGRFLAAASWQVVAGAAMSQVIGFSLGKTLGFLKEMGWKSIEFTWISSVFTSQDGRLGQQLFQTFAQHHLWESLCAGDELLARSDGEQWSLEPQCSTRNRGLICFFFIIWWSVSKISNILCHQSLVFPCIWLTPKI